MEIDRITEVDELLVDITFVPNENLPLLREAALLLSELLPPWDNKAAYIQPLTDTLSLSAQHEKIFEEYFYPADQLLNPDIA